MSTAARILARAAPSLALAARILAPAGLAVLVRPASACKTVWYMGSAVQSPTWGEVPRDVVLAGQRDADYMLSVDGPMGSVDLELLGDGLYGLPLGIPSGAYSWRDAGREGRFEVVPTAEWSPGPSPGLMAGEVEFDWRSEYRSCPRGPLTHYWRLYAMLELDFPAAPESAGWFVTLRHEGELFTRVEVPRDGGPLGIDMPAIWTDTNGELCLDLELTEPRGTVVDTIELPCQSVPMKPPFPACSAASTPAALLLAFLPMAAVLRRRDSRPSAP